MYSFCLVVRKFLSVLYGQSISKIDGHLTSMANFSQTKNTKDLLDGMLYGIDLICKLVEMSRAVSGSIWFLYNDKKVGNLILV